MISSVLFSEEENSTEKRSDLPSPTQGACSSTAKSLPMGREKRGWTCQAHLRRRLWFTPWVCLQADLSRSSLSGQPSPTSSGATEQQPGGSCLCALGRGMGAPWSSRHCLSLSLSPQAWEEEAKPSSLRLANSLQTF